jgi:uncharacterized delta-60 repeat protein
MKKIYFAACAWLWLSLTFSVSGQVTQEWAAKFDGNAGGNDVPYSIALDNLGNVYVAGETHGTGSDYDYAVVKYTSGGAQVWMARYNGPAEAYDAAVSIVVDASGNAYVTGSSTGIGTEKDYATMKYDSSGVEQWVVRYNGPGNGDDSPTHISLDISGNIYVTGRSEGSGTGEDYATIKYSPDGVELWVQRYNGTGNGEDDAKAMTLDESGNIYVTGSSVGDGTGKDYVTIKYNSDGSESWVARYNGPASEQDVAAGIVFNSQGDVYITGFSRGTGTNFDYATIKYNSSGVQQWVQRYNGPGNGSDGAEEIGIDAAGNIYVGGGAVGKGMFMPADFRVVKYDASGRQLWTAFYDGPGRGDEAVNDMFVSPGGDVYITGGSVGSGTSYDFATVKYDSSGATQWVARYDGPMKRVDGANSIAVDANGNVYVTGFVQARESFDFINDWATVKYSQR